MRTTITASVSSRASMTVRSSGSKVTTPSNRVSPVLSGGRTDGTILWRVGPKTIRSHIGPLIGEAAAAAGRPAPSIVCSIPVLVTDDPTPAPAFLAEILADYATLPSYRAMMDREGVAGLGELSIVGGEDEVPAAIGEIAESGSTDFTPVPMDGDPDEKAPTMEVLTGAMNA